MFQGFKGFVEFMVWIIDMWSLTLGIIIGVATGVIVAVGIAPAIYRAWHRKKLRQEWKRDAPMESTPFLSPSWVEYDPDELTVDHRCVCHGRRIGEGERVLLRPEIGPFGMLQTSVYCQSIKETV